jgi:hypothetical protein
MRAVAALLLVCSAAAAQEPARRVRVVLLPTAIRDSMSAIWSQSNLNWNEASDASSRTWSMNAVRPTHAYLGCMTGELTGDTLRVLHLAPAENVRHRESAVTGDCSKVPGVIGTWHTHPYRVGFQGSAIKERGLSGLDLRTFQAAGELLALVVWDSDSLDVAVRAPEGGMRHPAPYVIR